MLEVEYISKHYGSQCVLSSATIAVDSEIKVLLGINGCGKSTLLKIIAGIVKADTGCIRLHERDITRLPPEKRKVGYVPQKTALFPHMSVKQNIVYGIRRKAPGPDLVDKVIGMLGLGDLLHRKPNELSGGYKSRVSLARALAPQPDIMLLDEPLSDIDAVIKEKLLPEFREVIRFMNIPALYVTHDPAEAEQVGDTFAFMKDGYIKGASSPQDAFEMIQSTVHL